MRVRRRRDSTFFSSTCPPFLLDRCFERKKMIFDRRGVALRDGIASECRSSKSVASASDRSPFPPLPRCIRKHVASPPPPQFRARGRRLMSIAPVASPVLATLRVAASTRESPSPARRVAPARSRVFERVVVRSRAVPSDTTSASVMSADVPSLRLVYFDVMAKGMQVTMVAHHSGLSWEGKPGGFAWRTGRTP